MHSGKANWAAVHQIFADTLRNRMIEFRSVKLSLWLILLLQFTETKQSSSVLVRGGEEVTLSCENIDPVRCIRINWVFHKPGASAVDLVKLGQTGLTPPSRARGDRLSLSANCSLLIQRVTAEDVGTYFCQQVQDSNQKENRHTVALSLVTITEEKDDDDDDEEVTLKCSVLSNVPCTLGVKWLLNGKSIDRKNQNLKTEQSACSSQITFQTSHFVYEAGRYSSLQCEVEERDSLGRRKQPHVFTFRSQSPGRKNPNSPNSEATQASGLLWLYITVALGLAAFLLAVGIIIKRKKIKGNKTQMDENLGLNPTPSLSAPEMNQDTDEPDANISYATIILPRKTNSQVRGNEAAVTYSAVRVGTRPDPSDLYASVR